MVDFPMFVERSIKSLVDGVGTIADSIMRREKEDAFRLQFAERAGYLVTTLKLTAGNAQALPPANGYMVLSCTGAPSALGLTVGEQSQSQQWGLGLFVRTGEKYARPRPSFIFSSIAQTVTVVYVVGGADLVDNRAYPLVGDTARRAVASMFEAGAGTTPPASASGSIAIVAAGNGATANTSNILTGNTYLIRARARLTGTAAGQAVITMRFNGTSINLLDAPTVGIGGVFDTNFGGDFLVTPTTNGPLDMLCSSVSTFAGQFDGSINVSRQTS